MSNSWSKKLFIVATGIILAKHKYHSSSGRFKFLQEIALIISSETEKC